MNYFKENRGLAGYFDAGMWNLDTISKQKLKKPYYQAALHPPRKSQSRVKYGEMPPEIKFGIHYLWSNRLFSSEMMHAHMHVIPRFPQEP